MSIEQQCAPPLTRAQIEHLLSLCAEAARLPLEADARDLNLATWARLMTCLNRLAREEAGR